jgi:hypothetical protein
VPGRTVSIRRNHGLEGLTGIHGLWNEWEGNVLGRMSETAWKRKREGGEQEREQTLSLLLLEHCGCAAATRTLRVAVRHDFWIE